MKLNKILQIKRLKYSGKEIVPYIGLEHIGQGTMSLIGRGSSSDVSSDKFVFKKGDILFGKLRPYFKKVVKTDFDGICSTDIWVISAKEGVDQDYLFYFLSTDQYIDLATRTSTGTRMPRADWSFLKDTEWEFPPLPEQKRISSILSSFDNKIEQLKKENNILEDIAQNIFKEWFVKYNFPNKDGKPYRDNKGKMIDSELGLIPEGWRVVSLTDIADFVNGLPMQKYRPNEGEGFLPVIKIKELNSGYSKDTEKARADLDEKYIVNPGDVVFSWSGSIGMNLWKYSKGALNQHLFKVTSKDYPKWFYYYWIKHYLPEFKQIAEGKATTMGHIQRGHLTHCLVPIPKKIEKSFVLGDLIDKGICNNRTISLLEEQKKISLNKLLK